MRKFVYIAFIICFFIFLKADRGEILEKVEVVNVEVPVRVVYKGQPVDNLKKSDFRLYQDKKPVEINGFFIKRKKIAVENVRLNSAPPPPHEPRYFVLVLNIIDYNFHLKDGLNFMFKKVLRPGDRLMLMANNKVVFFNSLDDKEGIYKRAEFIIKNQALNAKNTLLSYLVKVDRELILSSYNYVGQSHYGCYVFLKNYLEFWRDYKRRFLTPDLNKYYYFASHLDKIKEEKWVINFFQFELFPKMKLDTVMSYIENLIAKLELNEDGELNAFAKILNRLLYQINQERNVENLFPTEQISKLFCHVGATFHSVFLPTTIESTSRDFEYKRVASALQNNLREITRRTGGSLITSHNLESAIATMGKKEDIFYILTFAPRDPSRASKISIEVKNKKYRLYYDDRIRVDYIEAHLKENGTDTRIIVIEDADFENGNLFFRIKGIMFKETESGKKGQIKVRILVEDEKSRTVYDQSRILSTVCDEININIKMKWLNEGYYNIVVEALDLLTGKSTLEYITINSK